MGPKAQTACLGKKAKKRRNRPAPWRESAWRASSATRNRPVARLPLQLSAQEVTSLLPNRAGISNGVPHDSRHTHTTTLPHLLLLLLRLLLPHPHLRLPNNPLKIVPTPHKRPLTRLRPCRHQREEIARGIPLLENTD